MTSVNYPIIQDCSTIVDFFERLLDASVPEKLDARWFIANHFITDPRRLLRRTYAERQNIKELQNKDYMFVQQYMHLLNFLRFTDSNDQPTHIWREFRGSNSNKVFTQAVISGYQEIFTRIENPSEKGTEELSNVIRETSSANRIEISYISTTFKALCAMADFSLIDDLSSFTSKIENHDKPQTEDQIQTAPITNVDRSITIEESLKDLRVLSLEQEELFIEAIECVRNDLWRAAHVMAWAGFMDFFQNELAHYHSEKLLVKGTGVQKFRNVEDLRQNTRESQLIDAANKINLIDFGELSQLKGLLNKRHTCAHPGGPKRDLNQSLGYISELIEWVRTIQRKRPT